MALISSGTIRGVFFGVVLGVCQWLAIAVHAQQPLFIYTMDVDGQLSMKTRYQIEELAEWAKYKTNVNIMVAVKPKISPLSSGFYGSQLVSRLKTRLNGFDRSILIVADPAQSDATIYVGDKLQAIFPESQINNILKTKISPPEKSGYLNMGLVDGVIAISNSLAHYYGVRLDLTTPLDKTEDSTRFAVERGHKIVWAMIGGVWLVIMFRHQRLIATILAFFGLYGFVKNPHWRHFSWFEGSGFYRFGGSTEDVRWD